MSRPSSFLARLSAWLHPLRLIAERFRSANLALTASSLTFTTLLTLVPFAAVALSAFTAFPMFAKAQDFLQRWLMESLIPEAIARQVLDYITQFAAKASRLGLVGFSMLVVTVLMLILTIDRTLNNIWRVRRLRPLGQRVLIYWAAITLGPLLLGLSLVFTSYVVSASRGMVQQVPGSVRLVFDSLQFFVLAAGMAALYHYVPNTLVRWRHAWMGGLFVAAAMELAKKGLALYLGQVPTYSAIYGTFATLPILLIWIYMAWLIVLLGAVITAELPTLQARATRHTEGEGARLQLAIEVLQQLHASAQGQPRGLHLAPLAQRLQVPTAPLEAVLGVLCELDWVGAVDDSQAQASGEQPLRYVLLVESSTPLEPLLQRLGWLASPGMAPLWQRAGVAQWRVQDVLQASPVVAQG